MKILYVEDNEDLRETIGLLLAGGERELIAYGTAEQALAAIEREAFDVLVTDVSLPGMSGTDLARHVLRTQPDHWVVLCSGYDFGTGLATLGPNVRSMTKSFQPGVLQKMVDDIAAALDAARH